MENVFSTLNMLPQHKNVSATSKILLKYWKNIVLIVKMLFQLWKLKTVKCFYKNGKSQRRKCYLSIEKCCFTLSLVASMLKNVVSTQAHVVQHVFMLSCCLNMCLCYHKFVKCWTVSKKYYLNMENHCQIIKMFNFKNIGMKNIVSTYVFSTCCLEMEIFCFKYRVMLLW